MLDRFRKPGGFAQLVQFLETCEPAKQEKFIGMIAKENEELVDELKSKMITPEKVMGWPPERLADITDVLPVRFLAILLHGASEEWKTNATGCLGNDKKMQLKTIMDDLEPTPGQKVAAGYKLIECVRDLMKSGTIQIQSYDSTLYISEDQQVA